MSENAQALSNSALIVAKQIEQPLNAVLACNFQCEVPTDQLLAPVADPRGQCRERRLLQGTQLLGVHIALDDFGSGYSCLSYLHAFPFEKIKIDWVFVGDLENNHHSMAIVRAIVTLGHSLNIPVLAEGVENESQLSFLAQEGCDEVQGYLTGKPQPIEAYAEPVGNVTARPSHRALAG